MNLHVNGRIKWNKNTKNIANDNSPAKTPEEKIVGFKKKTQGEAESCYHREKNCIIITVVNQLTTATTTATTARTTGTTRTTAARTATRTTATGTATASSRTWTTATGTAAASSRTWTAITTAACNC